MKTDVLPPAPETITRAAHALRQGELVALPTETVYGLAANALDPVACARIFEAKERPLSDPLIVHLPDLGWLERIARPGALALRIAAEFWPGPLTMVLSRTELVPDLVTAGQTSVAVRMSAHPIFGAIAREADLPLAAPSANRFGRISPTRASHVLSELDGRVGLIVDGGPCLHGIESTIALVGDDFVQVLRHGPITKDQLSKFAEVRSTMQTEIATPGSLKSHYAPVTPLDIVENLPIADREQTGLLAWKPVADSSGFLAVEILSSNGDLREVAANLYAGMRRLDESGLTRILALPVPEDGLGVAIMERLRKAAARE